MDTGSDDEDGNLTLVALKSAPEPAAAPAPDRQTRRSSEASASGRGQSRRSASSGLGRRSSSSRGRRDDTSPSSHARTTRSSLSGSRERKTYGPECFDSSDEERKSKSKKNKKKANDSGDEFSGGEEESGGQKARGRSSSRTSKTKSTGGKSQSPGRSKSPIARNIGASYRLALTELMAEKPEIFEKNAGRLTHPRICRLGYASSNKAAIDAFTAENKEKLDAIEGILLKELGEKSLTTLQDFYYWKEFNRDDKKGPKRAIGWLIGQQNKCLEEHVGVKRAQHLCKEKESYLQLNLHEPEKINEFCSEIQEVVQRG
ncbi:hypothetical protein THAOC_12512, partial [Thalassiosira oceanica]